MLSAKPFSSLAHVYDAIMQDIDYGDWVDFILTTLAEGGWHGQEVLDLGCGTGNSSLPFTQQGFVVTGLDASAEMLEVAKGKLPLATFVQGDFTDFSLAQDFDLVVSLFDSLNNLLSPGAFAQMLARVQAHLRPGGYFVFDINTTPGLRELWEGDRAEGWAEGIYYLWQHSFDEASGLAKVEAYCRADGLEFTEVHYERPYDPPELLELLTGAGFIDVQFLEHPSGGEIDDETPRLWVLAQRPKA